MCVSKTPSPDDSVVFAYAVSRLHLPCRSNPIPRYQTGSDAWEEFLAQVSYHLFVVNHQPDGTHSVKGLVCMRDQINSAHLRVLIASLWPGVPAVSTKGLLRTIKSIKNNPDFVEIGDLSWRHASDLNNRARASVVEWIERIVFGSSVKSIRKQKNNRMSQMNRIRKQYQKVSVSKAVERVKWIVPNKQKQKRQTKTPLTNSKPRKWLTLQQHQYFTLTMSFNPMAQRVLSAWKF